MALIAHQTQVSHSSFFVKYKASADEVIWRSFAACHVYRKNEFTSLKLRFHSRCQPIIIQKKRTFKVLFFKGNAQNDEHEREDSGSKRLKSQVQLSLSHHEEEDALSDSLDVHKRPLSYTDGREGNNRVGSTAIKKLFTNWLVMLRTQTVNDNTVDESVKEEPVQSTHPASKHDTKSTNAQRMLNTALMYFVRVDAAISIPLLLFVPLYLSIRGMYGADVASELRPLWVLGPLTMAIYIKVIQRICSLYFFLFSQAAKHLPAYSLWVYRCIAEGKLWEPIVRIKNLDKRAFFKQKIKQFREGLAEWYLDFIDSIWPFYCRIIRALKTAHII